MESLNPCLELIFEVKKAIEAGDSPKQYVKNWCQGQHEFQQQVKLWLSVYEKNGDSEYVIKMINSIYRKTLLRLLQKSFEGHSILRPLEMLEAEVICACRQEIDAFITTLPYKLMIPVLVLMFPALLILIFGPLLASFTQSLSSI